MLHRHPADTRQQVYRALEAAAEQPRARQEQVADAGELEVEGAVGRARALDDLEVQQVEEGPDELFLRGRDVRPQRVAGLDDVEPFEACVGGGGGEAVVEEGFDGVALGGGRGVFGDEADEATCAGWSVYFTPL